MYGLALRQLGGDAAAAEDVVHDAWLRGVAKLASFRGESAFRSWLCGFVVRIAWESQRQAASRFVEAEQTSHDESDAAEIMAERADLERAVAALPSGFRQVLLLHDVEGYTHEEIGTMLGIAPGTSKSQLSRARASLRRLLTEEN